MEKQRRPILGTGRECRSRPVRVLVSIRRPGPVGWSGIVEDDIDDFVPFPRAITTRIVNLEVEVIRQVDVVSSEQRQRIDRCNFEHHVVACGLDPE